MTTDITVVPGPQPVFILRTPSFSYILRVDANGDLVHAHFGAPSSTAPAEAHDLGGWVREQCRREFPDVGRGDMRLPAVHIQHASGHTVSHFSYAGYKVLEGKPALVGQPHTHGGEDAVSTLQVQMKDSKSDVTATLSYSVFARGAIARSVAIRNDSKKEIRIERLASLSLDMPSGPLEMVHHYGNWGREFAHVRRKVEHGNQGFQSVAGYSSHHYNPFVALVRPETTESAGEAWGFNLVYSGSFAVDVERDFHGNSRVLLGLNPLHLSWTLAPGETFESPECIAVYSSAGLGGMSRTFHNLYRHHLSRSKFTLQPRPVLLNNWEATWFDMDEDRLLPIAETAAKLGVHMFVMDDGWFGDKHPRVDDHAGLGDWVVNSKRFKNGLGAFVDKVTSFKVAHAADAAAKLKFGIWFEPEMVNPVSELYEAHPDWVLHAPGQDRTEGRFQLVLNLGRKDVQDHIIKVIGNILASADISYVKWDNNRAMHELAHPSDAHKYILGMYRVIDTLTTRFPDVLWEGCASGGGRFDPGLLYYWPQHWTSDNTDAHDRLYIQFAATIAYPASSMGCHVSVVPNHQTGRVTPMAFRAHVAMMGGGFGFELDLNKIPEEERAVIPGLIKLSEEINPIVVTGNMYRLANPWESNWPAAQYMASDGSKGVVLVFQIRDMTLTDFMPFIKLQGLDRAATYEVVITGHKEDEAEKRDITGEELMAVGLRWRLRGEYQSKAIRLRRK